MAEVPFRPARQLSEYKGKGASASREQVLRITVSRENLNFGLRDSATASYQKWRPSII